MNAQYIDSRQQHLETVAALEGQGDLTRLEKAITSARDDGVTIMCLQIIVVSTD